MKVTCVEYNSFDEFVQETDLTEFALVRHYISYDSLYTDYSDYYVFYAGLIPVFILFTHKNENKILVVETAYSYRSRHIGSYCLTSFLKKHRKSWSLISVKTAIDFYKKCGFIEDTNIKGLMTFN